MDIDKTTKTLVIPAYTVDSWLEKITLECAESHKDKVDQIIISEDGGQYSEKLRDIADIYIYNKLNRGFTYNVNTGWKLSRTDYTIIANSDTSLVSKSLKGLCIPNQVMCPKICNFTQTNFTGAYFVVPRSVQEEYGMLNEYLQMYGSDDEFYERTKHLFVKDEGTIVYHHKGQTMESAKIDVPRLQQLDSNRMLQLKDECK